MTPSPLFLATIDQRIEAKCALSAGNNGPGSMGRSMPEASAPLDWQRVAVDAARNPGKCISPRCESGALSRLMARGQSDDRRLD